MDKYFSRMFSNFSHYLASYFNDGKIKDANSGNSVSTIKAQSDCSKLSCVEDSSDDDLVMVTKPSKFNTVFFKFIISFHKILLNYPQ